MFSRVINLALSTTDVSGPSLLHLLRSFNIRREVVSRVLMEEEAERERKKEARRQAKLEREAKMEEERIEKKRQRQMKRQATVEARNKLMEEKQKMKDVRKQNLLKLQAPQASPQQVNHAIKSPTFNYSSMQVKKQSLVQNVLVKMSNGQMRHCIRMEDGTIVPIERGSQDSQQSKVMSDIMMTPNLAKSTNPTSQPCNVPVISLKRKPPVVVRPQVTTNCPPNLNNQVHYTNGHNPSAVQRRPSYPTLGSVVVRHSNLPQQQRPRFVRIPSCGPVVVGHRPSVIRAYKPMATPLSVQQRPVVVRPSHLQIVRPNSFYPQTSQVGLQKQLYTLPKPITSQQIIRPVSAYNQSVHQRSVASNNHVHPCSTYGEAPKLQPFNVTSMQKPIIHTTAVNSQSHVTSTSNPPVSSYENNIPTNEVKVVSSPVMTAAKPQFVASNNSNC